MAFLLRHSRSVAPRPIVVRNKAATAWTRPFSSQEATAPPKIHLFQYHICPFCNRVKALMDYANILYELTEVNPLTKAEIKPFKEQHTKVPIATLQSGDSEEEPQPVFGSDAIIGRLLEDPFVQMKLQEQQQSSLSLSNFSQSETAQKWTDFAIDQLAVLLYPNMCKSWSDSYRAFDYVNHQPQFSRMQQFMIQNIGSLAMTFAASKVKKKHNIQDEEKALEEAITELEVGLEQQTYLSKKQQPDLGDLAVFGTLRAIEGLPVHDKLILERGGSISAWYQHMKEQVSSSPL